MGSREAHVEEGSPPDAAPLEPQKVPLMPWAAKGRTLFGGNPNGVINGQVGDICQDTATGTGLWVCANGGTVWTQAVASGVQSVTAGAANIFVGGTITNPTVAVAASPTFSGTATATTLSATGTVSTVNLTASGTTTLSGPSASINNATLSGTTTAPEYTASGLTGATATSRYVGATASGAPASGTFQLGDFIIDQTAKIFVCTVAGTPGTWVQVGGTGSGPPVGHEVFINGQEPPQAQTNWTTKSFNTNDYFSTRLLSDGAQNDSIEWDCWLPAGTYDYTQWHSADSNRGIYTVTLDGTSIGTIDGYNASTNVATVSTITGVTSAGGTGGKVRVKLQMLTKNASSSSFFGVLSGFAFHRTA